MRRPSPRLLLLLPTVTLPHGCIRRSGPAARRRGDPSRPSGRAPSSRPTPRDSSHSISPTPRAPRGRRGGFARRHLLQGVVRWMTTRPSSPPPFRRSSGSAESGRGRRRRARQAPATTAPRRCGVAVPRFELLATAETRKRVARRALYPCVLKPLRLSASARCSPRGRRRRLRRSVPASHGRSSRSRMSRGAAIGPSDPSSRSSCRREGRGGRAPDGSAC